MVEEKKKEPEQEEAKEVEIEAVIEETKDAD